MNLLEFIFGNPEPVESHKEKEIKTCDHEKFEESVARDDIINLADAKIEGDTIAIPVYERVEEYCRDCGVRPAELKDHVANGRWGYSRLSRWVTIPITGEIDADRSLSDAIEDSKSDDSSFGSEAGGVTD